MPAVPANNVVHAGAIELADGER